MEENIEFTEAESIEIGRRTSEVNSIINSASKYFAHAIDLNEQILEKEKLSKSFWLWGFGIIGFILHLFLREKSSGFELDIGSGIVMLTVLIYASTSFDSYNLSNKLTAVNSKLYDLERFWMAATDSNTFWEMKKYIDVILYDSDLMSDEALKWILEQKDNVISSVCGWEKAKKIAEYNKRVMKEMSS